MSQVTKKSTAETIRMGLQSLRALHGAAVWSEDQRLRAAMAEYRKSLDLFGKCEAA